MALFAYYGLQFPKAKMIWLLPNFHFTQQGTFHTGLLGWSWFQFRTLWVALFYLAGDIAYYFIEEMNGSSSVSFSGHIAGFAAGALFWYLTAPKNFAKEPRDFLEEKLDTLLPLQSATQVEQNTKPVPKQLK